MLQTLEIKHNSFNTHSNTYTVDITFLFLTLLAMFFIIPASQLVFLRPTTHHPSGLDFRLFKDNPMAFWTSTSTTQFEPPGTLTTAVCVNTSQLPSGWPLSLDRNNLDARSEKKPLTWCMSSVWMCSF